MRRGQLLAAKRAVRSIKCRPLAAKFLPEEAPRIRSWPQAAKRAVPRISGAVLAPKLTSTAKRKLRNCFLAGKAPRTRSWPQAAKRAVPRITGRPLAAKQTRMTERRLRNWFLARERPSHRRRGHRRRRRRRRRPLAAKRAVPRVTGRPLAAKQTSTTERRLRNLSRIAAGHQGARTRNLRDSARDSTSCFVPELVARAYRRPLAPETTLLVDHHADGKVHCRPLAAYCLARCC